MVDQLQFAWITLVALRYLSWDYHGRCRGKREAEIRTLTDLRNHTHTLIARPQGCWTSSGAIVSMQLDVGLRCRSLLPTDLSTDI